MPVQVSYPGVYIEEIPSGVHTIVGVATSIAAFLGRAASGPVNDPVEVNGIGEYERLFGPVSSAFPMSLAVADFFQNGGSRALVVRLFKGTGGTSTVTIDDLVLKASSQGKWGDALKVGLTLADNANPQIVELRKRLGIDAAAKLFDLEVTDTRPGGKVERHSSLTLVPSLRRLDQILLTESSLLRWEVPSTLPTLPNVTSSATATGQSGADSANLDPVDDYQGSRDGKTGLFALEKADLFNLLCIPPDTRNGTTNRGVYQKALPYCVERRAMLIVDPEAGWSTPVDQAVDKALKGPTDMGLTGPEARNAALYFPRIVQSDPTSGELLAAVPCGVIAGVMARTDVQRGVWKAPAGLEANLSGVDGLELNLNDGENGRLNDVGVNVLRSFPVTGRVVWGARTLRGANLLGDEYKYVPVRRLALFLEESLYRGTKWAVFEPNDEPLWAQIRLNVGAFLQNLFRQGAFQGRAPREAYFVKCDKDTTTQNDINLGIVNVLIGFAPLKPAEFVILKIQQLAGQIEA